MSVQIQLYVLPEDHDPEVRRALFGGPMMQLTADSDMKAERDLLDRSDKVIVGSSNDDYPKAVRDAITSGKEIDEAMIAAVNAVSLVDDEDSRYGPHSVDEWLEEHEGETVYVLNA